MSTATKTTLRDLIVSALQDARMWREEKFNFCSDCRDALAGICPDHEEDSELTDEYEAAKAAVERADTPLKLAALLAGTERAA